MLEEKQYCQNGKLWVFPINDSVNLNSKILIRSNGVDLILEHLNKCSIKSRWSGPSLAGSHISSMFKHIFIYIYVVCLWIDFVDDFFGSSKRISWIFIRYSVWKTMYVLRLFFKDLLSDIFSKDLLSENRVFFKNIVKFPLPPDRNRGFLWTQSVKLMLIWLEIGSETYENSKI